MAVSKYKPLQSEIDYFNSVTNESTINEIPYWKSLASALGKGLSEGVVKLGEMLGPTASYESRSEMKPQRQSIMNELLPSNEGFGEGVLQRAGEAFPSLASGVPGASGIQALLGSVLGGSLGEGAKQLGLGETAQSAGELIGQLGPNLAKRIPSKLIPTQSAKAETELMRTARNFGMAEEDLPLVMNQRGPVRDMLTDVMSKGEKTVKRFEKTRDSFNRVFEQLEQSPVSQIPMKGQDSSQFINSLSKRMSQLPASQREIIQKEYQELIGSDLTGKDLMKFWKDINYQISKGEGGFGILKEDLTKGIEKISPELSNDFMRANKLYGNFKKSAEMIAPDLADKLLNKGESGAILYGILSGNTGIIQKIMGVSGGRQAAQSLIMNPRLQNLATRFANGLAKKSPSITKKVYDDFIIELGKTDADLAKYVSEFDPEEFFKND